MKFRTSGPDAQSGPDSTPDRESRITPLTPAYAVVGATDALLERIRDLGAERGDAGVRARASRRRDLALLLAGARAVPGVAAEQLRIAASTAVRQYAGLAGRGRGVVREHRPQLRLPRRRRAAGDVVVSSTATTAAAAARRHGVARTAAARTSAPSPAPTRQPVADVDAVRPARPTPARGSGIEAASTVTRSARRAAVRAAGTARRGASAAQRTAAPGSSPS